MRVTESIEGSFRDLVMSEPYEKITVARVCREANVTRTLFYSYYDDKSDLLDEIIYKDIVQPVAKLQESLPGLRVKSAPQLILEQFYLSILERRDFYSRLNAINSCTNFTTVLTNRCSLLCSQILKEAKLSELEKTYLAYFTAAAHAMLISKWIEREYDASPGQMAQFFRKWVMDYWGRHFELEYSLND